jgi:hypothetical protein
MTGRAFLPRRRSLREAGRPSRQRGRLGLLAQAETERAPLLTLFLAGRGFLALAPGWARAWFATNRRQLGLAAAGALSWPDTGTCGGPEAGVLIDRTGVALATVDVLRERGAQLGDRVRAVEPRGVRASTASEGPSGELGRTQSVRGLLTHTLRGAATGHGRAWTFALQPPSSLARRAGRGPGVK